MNDLPLSTHLKISAHYRTSLEWCATVNGVRMSQIRLTLRAPSDRWPNASKKFPVRRCAQNTWNRWTDAVYSRVWSSTDHVIRWTTSHTVRLPCQKYEPMRPHRWQSLRQRQISNPTVRRNAFSILIWLKNWSNQKTLNNRF